MHVRTGVQMFGATGFRQATPVNRALGLLGANRRKPSYRYTHRPAMLGSSSQARMSGRLWDEMPLTLGLAAGGVGAIMIADILPTPFKTIARVAGVGLLAVGAINLLTGTAEATDDTEEVTRKIPIGDPTDFEKVSATILRPSRNSEIPLGFLSSDYDVEVLWRNASEKELTIQYQVYVEETPIVKDIESKFQGIAHSGAVTLGPNEAKTVEMEIPLKNLGWGAAATAINFSLRKVSTAGQAFEVAQTSFAVYPNAVEHFFNPAAYRWPWS